MRRLSLIVLAGCILAASAAIAQDQGATVPGGTPKSSAKKPGPKKPGGTRSAPARPGGTTSRTPPGRAWAKLCETPSATGSDLFGKPQAVGVTTCLVVNEQIDILSGVVRVAAGVQQAAGRQTFIIRVAADANRASGVRLLVLPGDLWRRALSNDTASLFSSRVRKLTLAYRSCDADGCFAETTATSGLLADLKSDGGLIVAILRGRQAIAYPVPLSGFREAYDGPPLDSARFYAARAELLRRLRARNKGLPPPWGQPGDGQGVVPRRPPGDGPYVPPRRPGDQDI
jgi:invasion protein IalB